MEDQNIAIRLKGFIDSEGLTNSQFADMCGIPRPSLSQIISGRNKKVSDVLVAQIHKAFPQLSVLWLLFGEGEMLTIPSLTSGTDAQNSGPGRSSDYDDANFGESHVSGQYINPAESEFGMLDYDNDDLEADYPFESKKNATNQSAALKSSNVRGLTPPSKELQIADAKIVELQKQIVELQSQIEKFNKNPRKVTQITVYYDDSTFETFSPRGK